MYRINIDRKTGGTCYETPEEALIRKRQRGFLVVSWEKFVELARRRDFRPIFVPTVDISYLEWYLRGKTSVEVNCSTLFGLKKNRVDPFYRIDGSASLVSSRSVI